MRKLNEITLLIEDFKSYNESSWIKFKTSKLWSKSKNLWKPFQENSEIINLLDGFIVNYFKFKPLGKDWRETDAKDVQKSLEISLSYNMIHGYDAWNKEKGKELSKLILESFEGKVRYFSNVKGENFYLRLRHNDYRDTDQEYGVIIYDVKNICGIWISLHDDPHLIKISI